jgi:hypothetical protein
LRLLDLHLTKVKTKEDAIVKMNFCGSIITSRLASKMCTLRHSSGYLPWLEFTLQACIEHIGQDVHLLLPKILGGHKINDQEKSLQEP